MSRHGRWTAYTAHDDLRAATGNTIALVIAGNGPFYPLYAFAMIGWPAWPTLLTMLSSPVFAAVPWVMRRDSRAGRALLALMGTLNTVWSVKLLGANTGIDLFLLPCATLAVMLWRRAEWWMMLPLLAFPIVAFLGSDGLLGAPLLPFTVDDAARLTALNRASVATLTGFLAVLFSRMS